MKLATMMALYGRPKESHTSEIVERSWPILRKKRKERKGKERKTGKEI